MKQLICILAIAIFSFSVMATDHLELKIQKSFEAQTQATDDLTEVSENAVGVAAQSEPGLDPVGPLTFDPAPEAVKEPASSTISSPLVADVQEITPTNPYENLTTYFVFLMTIVIGIYLLAACIPAPRNKNEQ